MGEQVSELWAFVEDVPKGSTPAAWLVAWLPSGRRHVWLAEYAGPGVDGRQAWLVLNPAACGFDHSCLWTDVHLAQTMTEQGKTAIRLPVRRDMKRPYIRGWMTCVAFVKYRAGLRWPFVHTPGGLIRRAKREGFEVIWPTVPRT